MREHFQSRLLTIPVLTVLLVSILLRILPMLVGAYTWYMPQSGDTALTVQYGAPFATIAEYDAANQSLRLGVKVIGYASAIANGTMSAYAVAQSNGAVTGTLRWYIRGTGFGGAYPGFAGAWVIVKFIWSDLTAGAAGEVILLDDGLGWSDFGNWRDTYMDITLIGGHFYRFSLFVSTHAGITGVGAAVMDCGGLSIPDSRIEWGYLEVPNTVQAPSLEIFRKTGGYTVPAPGVYYYNFGESVVVEAFPTGSYYFSRWILDGQDKWGNPITVTMDSDHDLQPQFGIGGGGGDCPTLFVWNGADYVSEGVLPIHAESDITVQHTIQNTLALENGVYRLELRELDNYTSHLDQVRLYAVDDQGEWHLSPLAYANHSELGWVTWKLRFDDENRVDMTPTQTIALRFLPSIPYSETAYFVFETNGYNRKALY